MKIDNELLYGPSPCGSGKNFKFCCWPKCRDELRGDFSRAELLQIEDSQGSINVLMVSLLETPRAKGDGRGGGREA